MEGGPRLSLFGVIHMDAVGKVSEELDDVATAGDADAIFIEYPTDPGGVRTYLEVLLRAPAFLLGMAIMIFVHGPLYLAFARDLLPAEFLASERVAGRRRLPIHPVDDHPVQRAQAASATTTALNWLLVVPAFALEPVGAAATAAALLVGALTPVLLRRKGHRYLGPALLPVGIAATCGVFVLGYGASLLVLVGAVGLAGHVVTGIDQRNEAMLDRVTRIAREEGYEDAVLVTGKAHLGGQVSDAADRALTITRVHVSYWLDAGITHVAPFDESELPELGPGGGSLRERVRTELGDGLPRYVRRTLAALIDAALVVFGWFALVVVLAVVVGGATGRAVDSTVPAAMAVAWLVAPVGYHATLEARWGRTVGKRVLGLAVRGADGSGLDRRTALRRNVLRPIDALALYVASGVVMVLTWRDRSIPDLLADTRVRRPSREPDAGGGGDERGGRRDEERTEAIGREDEGEGQAASGRRQRTQF